MQKSFLTVVFVLGVLLFSNAQDFLIKGKIVDLETQTPLEDQLILRIAIMVMLGQDLTKMLFFEI